MNYQEIRILLDHPAVKLLSAQHAAMVLGFLFRAFKNQHRITIPEGQLRASLETYLEELRDSQLGDFQMTAAQYLTIWCDDNHGFLRKYYADNVEEAVFELTSGAEKALLWLEQLHPVGFVGTESRLEGIFNGLADILKNTTADPEERVKQLSDDIKRIQNEIDRIQVTGVATTYTAVQVNERFASIVSTARELLGDFRQVEENFKFIAQQIAEQHATPGLTKGTIVGNMLDSDDALRKSEQGQSFYHFWALLLSDERQTQFQEALKKVLVLKDLNEKLREHPLLPHLISHLLVEGEKVLSSHERMAANLRRVLDTTRIQDRHRVLQLVREIQALAIPLRNNPPDRECFFEIEELPEFFSSMGRQLWQARDCINLASDVEVADDQVTLDYLRRFRNLPHIQLQQLRKNVETYLNESSTITLENVLDRYPPKHGMVEVIGYLIVAVENPTRHYVGEEEQTITVPFPKPTKWRVPKILFCK